MTRDDSSSDGGASSDADASSDAATVGGSEDGEQRIAVTIIKGGGILCQNLQVDRDATVGQIVARMEEDLGQAEAKRYVDEGWKLVPLGGDPLRYPLKDPYTRIMSVGPVRRAVQDSTMWFQLAGPDCTRVD